MTKKPAEKTASQQDEERHREFMLAALRSASARLKLMVQEVDEIGVALNKNLIGSATAVAWLRDADLMWALRFLPGEISRIDATYQPELVRSDYPLVNEPATNGEQQ
jgi:hypothetical protein